MQNNKLFKGALIAALATSAIVITAPQAEAASKFKDVNYSKEYGKAVQNLVDRGIISGYPDGTFRPSVEVTRGQVAKILAGLLELDTTDVVNPEFTDIKPGDANYGAIAALENAGLVSGFTDGSFGVNRAITREQLASILTTAYNLYDGSEEFKLPFKDIVKYSEAYYNVGLLYKYNITKGITKDTFGLKDPVKRSQLAVFIHRIENYQKSRVMTAITAKDMKVDYVDATIHSSGTEDEEKEIFRVHYNEDKVEIEAVNEGKGSVVIEGYKIVSENEYERVTSVKYNVIVTKEDNKLKLKLEETDELKPGTVLFLEEDYGFDPKNIKLTTKDGHAVSEKVYSYEAYDFSSDEDEESPSEGKAYLLTLNELGEYIATVSDGKGKEVRVGILADESDYEIFAYEAIEKSEIFIPASEIGFAVKDYKIEQFTGALVDESVLSVDINAQGVTVKRAANGDALFAIRLNGTNGEKMYLHGLIYNFAGVTSIIHELTTQKEMEEPLLK